MIELTHITKHFSLKKETVHAVNDVSLTIHDGEIFGIIGFSGAGKSTLVRCINLLEHPTSGTVCIDGKDLTAMTEKDLRAERTKIGMIFQHFNLMKARTVYDNIAFPLKKSDLSKAEKDTKIKELLKLVDLYEKKDAYPSQLSGGQQQRVAIARALANDPKVLLCDEATSALDPQTTHTILNLLKKINETLGITIVIITHQMEVIKEICDRTAVMEHGEIAECGKTIDLYTHPQKEITRSLIASGGQLEMIAEDAVKDPSFSSGKVILLTYTAGTTKEALISEVSRKHNVDCSILYGNVDILKGGAIGRLLIVLTGHPNDLDDALASLKAAHTEIEVIRA